MKLHLPHILRAALLAALLCCTTAFGTVTVAVGGQDSSLEELTGAPEGSVSITVKGEDAILDHDLMLDGSADHYITVEEGHSLTIMGGLTFSNPWLDGWEHWDGKASSLSVRGEIIFAAGESVLVGCLGSESGTIIVQKGARLTLNNAGFLCVSLAVEEGGELVAGDDVNCSALNGKGTLCFSESTNGHEGNMTILGNNTGPANFGGKIDGQGFICVVGYIGDSGEPSLNSSRPGVLSTRQIFTNVTAEGVSLDTTIGDVSFAGSENKFRSLAVGDIYNGIIIEIDFRNPYWNSLRDTLTIEEGTKVSLGKLFDDPDWHYNEEVGYEKFDPQIYSPVRQRGFSFDMEDRSELVVKFGKGETGAKITASGAIVLKTTTWEEDVSNPIKPAVRVEFAENPGKDLKQLLIQANGIVLTSIEYGEHTAPDSDGQLHDHLTTFLVKEQYTEENSVSDLNKWLKENVTLEVDGYEDPYLMVEKKGGSLVQLYVVAGNGANLPDAPIETVPDNPGSHNPDTIFAPLAISGNMQAGAGMLYHAMNRNLPSSSELSEVVSVIGELARIGQEEQPAVAMAAMITEPGTQEMLIKEAAIDPAVARSEAQKLMAAVPGSSVPALGAAQRDAMRGQLSRATSQAVRAGREAARATDSSQGMRVWMEGMGGSSNLDRDGDESGYEHNAWGASVGVEKALQGGATTIGLSLAASYGDLKADAVDYAKGDLDTYYVNLYAHHRSGNFHHSLAASVGLSDAEFNRTVSGGVAPYVVDYSTSGSTNGTGFGVAYELAYDIALNEQKSSILQPMVGVSLVTTKMDGYDEGGAGDAGLHVGEQESTLTTLTAGARFVSQCGEAALGRAAVLEMRANVAVDMGDRRSEADVSFLGDRGYSGRVRSAETGAVGAQLGASVSVPVSSSTSIYVNGEADLRSGSNTWSVGAGASVMF